MNIIKYLPADIKPLFENTDLVNVFISNGGDALISLGEKTALEVFDLIDISGKQVQVVDQQILIRRAPAFSGPVKDYAELRGQVVSIMTLSRLAQRFNINLTVETIDGELTMIRDFGESISEKSAIGRLLGGEITSVDTSFIHSSTNLSYFGDYIPTVERMVKVAYLKLSGDHSKTDKVKANTKVLCVENVNGSNVLKPTLKLDTDDKIVVSGTEWSTARLIDYCFANRIDVGEYKELIGQYTDNFDKYLRTRRRTLFAIALVELGYGYKLYATNGSLAAVCTSERRGEETVLNTDLITLWSFSKVHIDFDSVANTAFKDLEIHFCQILQAYGKTKELSLYKETIREYMNNK